jgi:Fe-S cluster assembly protein SufB
MVEKQLSEEDIILDDIVTGPYKYGFKTEIETESFPKGLDLNIIQKIIDKKRRTGIFTKISYSCI